MGDLAARRLTSVLIAATVLLTAGCAWLDENAMPRGHTPEAGRSAEAAPPRSFTLVAGGDILIHSDVWAAAAAEARLSGAGAQYDFTPLFAPTAPVVSGADLALCHLEVPLATETGPFSNYPLFASPPQVATALAATGFDGCSTASNHTVDRGVTGVETTLAALDAAGLRHTGSARFPEEAGPAIYDVRGVRVAQLSYTYGLNGLVRPTDKPWLVNLTDDERMLADAAAARATGAEVVLVSMHWGSEYQSQPNPQQLELAPRLLDSPDIDLVLGHHAHVVQPLEQRGGKWVVYGMGNLIAGPSHNFAGGATREGILPRFTFTEDPARPGRFSVTDVEVTPTYISARPLRVLDVAAQLENVAGGGDVDRLLQARQRTEAVVLSRTPVGAVNVR